MTGTTPGEWCVAYHGTSVEFAKSILINNFQEGPGQMYENYDDDNHPGKKVGRGVYVTPEITIAEGYSKTIDGFKCVFMCRVNPLNIRIPKNTPNIWIVSGHSNDIRPYRLIIKKVE